MAALVECTNLAMATLLFLVKYNLLQFSLPVVENHFACSIGSYEAG